MEKKYPPNSALSQRHSVHKGFKSPQLSQKRDRCSQAVSSSASSPTSCNQQQSASQNHGDSSLVHGKNLSSTLVLQKEIDALSEQLTETEEQIRHLQEEGLDESELADHISKLHEYNDLRDAAQKTMGLIADLRGIPTRDLYPNYGLELDD